MTTVRTPRIVLALPAAVVAAAFFGAPSFAATPTPTPAAAPAPTSQGIIMRDGGICDPIRHIGC